jgi:IS4 transposase
VGEGRIPWAKFRGEKAGVKLHVRYDLMQGMPESVEESVALFHDSAVADELLWESFTITVMDRGYCNYARMDWMQETNQYFVIRLKKNTLLYDPEDLAIPANSVVRGDQHACLGSASKHTQQVFRIVSFQDDHGNMIHVATNLFSLPAEIIAQLYRARWWVEVFFRWIKQHLQVKQLFGTTLNAVYGQLYSALIAYLLVHWLHTESNVPLHLKKFSTLEFMRKLWLGQLPPEWILALFEFVQERSWERSLY